MVISNINDFASYIGSDIENVERDLYKYTDCGAWIEWNSKSMSVGSIVEGSSAEFHETFMFPFDSREYDFWIDELERLCDEAWHEANDGDELEGE